MQVCANDISLYDDSVINEQWHEWCAISAHMWKIQQIGQLMTMKRVLITLKCDNIIMHYINNYV